MEFNQLESFISVVKHNSFSYAAKELYITQPTVSNNIQNLEKELNTTLLNRTSKTINLTDSGKIFYKYAVELINIRDKAKYILSEHSNKVEGEIEITASSIPEQYILPYIIKDFLNIYPKVSFSMTHKNSKDIIDDILEGKLNFGIVGARYHSDMLEYIDFYEDELILCTPNNDNYTLSENDYLDIDALFSEKLILRKKGSGTRRLIEQKLSVMDISLDDLNIVSQIDSNEMIKKMIELGLGVSFISKIAVKNEIDLKLLKPLKIKDLELKRSFYFVYSKNRTLSPVVEAFKDFLINWKDINHITP
ncbi:LysR family transcriptional regulator [Sedimentibacter hydroxybenzoicus DSM 7310]|uniref:LysR family transcriptional regulator n=1 Tax=Sedimentibacter hydroxybenzoicus DSM 7310 TaxID=1123245 RepID=A0A974GXR9_SEDHY|nr:selenium metabolism-associated LysR family transcriptional regulator [Sedimentibacter hydroxybenzoicus]NYB75471.1 LysR family transcriptional regulator [Sedimentibacter hydroxybenzoicus DSM 7310]